VELVLCEEGALSSSSSDELSTFSFIAPIEEGIRPKLSFPLCALIPNIGLAMVGLYPTLLRKADRTSALN